MSPQSAGVSSAVSFGSSAFRSPVAVADDALFLEHVAPPEHPECGERLLAVRAGLERAAAGAGLGGGSGGAYLNVSFGDASEQQLARVHDPAYVESLGHLAGRSGYLDSDTYLSAGSVAAARRAAGAAVGLVETLHGGAARSGFALPRPPGHHALADRAMGFCLLNNVAVAAAHARALGRERVLVLDWDVHHGNGTEAMFYGDPRVLFVSLHQYPSYPGTGAASDLGQGDGRGHNVNLPLPPGATDSIYASAFERIVLPIIEQFAPDFALVSCGFDAHARDPLAQMALSAQAYAEMAAGLLRELPPTCPLGLVLEGGYDLQALTESSQAVAGVLLAGGRARPVSAPAPTMPEEQAAALRRVQLEQAPFWRLG
jgi:acetoin utilization deacetylase AcuC-like enzyme